MTSEKISNPLYFQEIIENLREIEKLFKEFKDDNAIRRISKHDTLIRGELNDLNIIWRRFIENRTRLLQLDPIVEGYRNHEGVDEEATKKAYTESELLNAKLKVDLKSLFLFGDILFNKLILLARAVYGHTNKIKYESFSFFVKSLRKLSDANLREYKLYEKIGEHLEKLDVVLGFYRDKFIVHVLGPYQEGVARGIFFPEFRLDHTSWKLDQFDFEKFNELLFQLKDLLPENDKYGRPLNKPSDPRSKVEVLFNNLYRITDPELKDKAAGYIRSVGLASPNIYSLAKMIRDTAVLFIEYIGEEIKLLYLK